jgi:AcrR family transcriptional regulator
LASQPEKRQRVIAAASKLIVANGLQCPMSAIALEAGVAMGSVYNYFASKDDLILAVYTELASEVNGIVRPIDRSLPHKDRIMRYVYDYIDFFWESKDRAVLFEYLSNAPLIDHQKLVEIFTPVREYHTALRTEAQRDGVVKSSDARIMATLIGGGIRNTLKWFRPGHAELEPDMREQIAEMCWSAIAEKG